MPDRSFAAQSSTIPRRAMSRRLTILAATILLLVAAAFALPGCDDERPKPVPATRPAAALDLELKPLTPLLPNRPTHVTVDRLGNVYWVQETDRGDDAMFVIGEGGIPRDAVGGAEHRGTARHQRSARAATSTESPPPQIAAATSTSTSWAQRAGGRSRASGRLPQRPRTMRILSDTDAVAAATGMGRSLPLARASVVCDGQHRLALAAAHGQLGGLPHRSDADPDVRPGADCRAARSRACG